MGQLPESSEPIFLSLARIIANGILAGAYSVGGQVPSTTELSAFFKINPITAGRALTYLAEKGILERHRGIGTFVTENAVELLRSERVSEFTQTFVDPLVKEARILSIPLDDIIEQIKTYDAIARAEQSTKTSQGGNHHDH